MIRHVDVVGGSLAVEEFVGSRQPVLAIHGISSQRKLWNWLRAEAPDLTLIAPDLRGRADSIAVQGPSSVAQHAEDMIAVLDAFGLDAIRVCGMSMGGFVAIDLATRFPERVKGLVLVDGGFPMKTPPGLTPELLPAVFADRLGRLEHQWDSLEDYLAFFTRGTAPLLDPSDPLLHDYLEHDLRDKQVRLSGSALLADAADVFFTANAWEELSIPIDFVYAEWSVGADSAPAYDAELVERYAPKCRSVTLVPGVDHAGSIMSKNGAAAVADVITAAIA